MIQYTFLIVLLEDLMSHIVPLTSECKELQARQQFCKEKRGKNQTSGNQKGKKVDEKMPLSHRHLEFCSTLMGAAHVRGLLLSNTAAK